MEGITNLMVLERLCSQREQLIRYKIGYRNIILLSFGFQSKMHPCFIIKALNTNPTDGVGRK